MQVEYAIYFIISLDVLYYVWVGKRKRRENDGKFKFLYTSPRLNYF
jgi:hypothetical protein